jgi:hypothetical protein
MTRLASEREMLAIRIEELTRREREMMAQNEGLKSQVSRSMVTAQEKQELMIKITELKSSLAYKDKLYGNKMIALEKLKVYMREVEGDIEHESSAMHWTEPTHHGRTHETERVRYTVSEKSMMPDIQFAEISQRNSTAISTSDYDKYLMQDPIGYRSPKPVMTTETSQVYGRNSTSYEMYGDIKITEAKKTLMSRNEELGITTFLSKNKSTHTENRLLRNFAGRTFAFDCIPGHVSKGIRHC